MNELIVSAKEYNIEPSRAEQIEKVFAPMVATLKGFEARFNEITQRAEIAICEETCNDARRLRLDIAKVRINTEKVRKVEKEEYLRAGKAIDGVANILKFAVVEKEERLEKIEKHFELVEQQRKEKLAAERAEELAKYECFNVPGLGEMANEVYANFMTGAKANFQAKKEAERKAEEERLAREKADREEREKIRLENERLKKEAAERETKIAEEKRLAEIERRKQEELLRQERAKAEAERKAIEEKARIQREKAEAEAKRLKAEQNAIIAKERAERERAEAELRAKAEAEEAEKKRKAAAEKRAKRAPDKEKLMELSKRIDALALPVVSTEEAQDILREAGEMLTKAAKLLKTKIENL